VERVERAFEDGAEAIGGVAAGAERIEARALDLGEQVREARLGVGLVAAV
jgi:hypothetical protein